MCYYRGETLRSPSGSDGSQLTSPSPREVVPIAPAAHSAAPGPAPAPGWCYPARVADRHLSASALCSPPW